MIGIEQPGIDQRAEHVADFGVFPRPGHGRLVADALLFDEAVDHHRDVHGHAWPPPGGSRRLAGCAGCRCRRPPARPFGLGGEGLAGQPACDAHGVAAFDQHPVDAGPGAQVGAGRDGLVHPFGGVPLGAAAAAQHALRAAMFVEAGPRAGRMNLSWGCQS